MFFFASAEFALPIARAVHPVPQAVHPFPQAVRFVPQPAPATCALKPRYREPRRPPGFAWPPRLNSRRAARGPPGPRLSPRRQARGRERIEMPGEFRTIPRRTATRRTRVPARWCREKAKWRCPTISAASSQSRASHHHKNDGHRCGEGRLTRLRNSEVASSKVERINREKAAYFFVFCSATA